MFLDFKATKETELGVSIRRQSNLSSKSPQDILIPVLPGKMSANLKIFRPENYIICEILLPSNIVNIVYVGERVRGMEI